MATNEIQKVEPRQMLEIPADAPLMTRLAMMIENGVDLDVDKMAKLQEMGERYEANEARKAYAADCTVVQSKIEAAVKTAKNPQTGSMYAKLEGVIEASKPVYTEHGFSVVFYEGKAEDEGNIRVYADVLHKAGHKETYHYDVPLGGVGIQGKVNMTAIHAKATSVTYGRRYLLCMIWNIPTQDDDGNGSGKKPIEVRQPTDEEWGLIDMICKAVPAPDGMRVDRKKVAAICYEATQLYPYHEKALPGIIRWFTDMDRPELFIPDKRSGFEIGQDMPGDEDSQPDTEAEATAAEKFGKENEIVPCRFLCNDCGNEYDTFKKIDQCPKCLKKNVLDRQNPAEDSNA